MKARKCVLPFFLLLLVVSAILLGCQAPKEAPDSQELIRMMSIIPKDANLTAQSGLLRVGYADIRANAQARPGVPMPVDFTAFRALDDHDRDLWMANQQRLISLAEDIRVPLSFDADLIKYYGLDYFEIDRTMEFGFGPDYGVIYGGHFDTDQIAETLVARTYTTTEMNGMTVLCGPVGCERGAETDNRMPDLGKTDPETLKTPGKYPFLGGRMYQQQPLALMPGHILNAPSWELLNAMTATAAGEKESLYDVPEYHAVASFAVAKDSLIQVYFFPPSYFSDWSLAAAGENASLDDLRKLQSELGVDETGQPLDSENLPEYSLGALVDQQEGADQVHSIVLVYTRKVDAERAAAEVVKRIPLQSAYLIWGEDQPVIDRAASEYTVEPSQVIHDPDAGRWLAIATVRVPMPSNEPVSELDDSIAPAGRLLILWYRSLISETFMPVQLTRDNK